MNENIFCMVYVEGKNAPTKKHLSQESARNEANRLCASTRCKAYVLKTTDMFIPPEQVEPVWVDLGGGIK